MKLITLFIATIGLIGSFSTLNAQVVPEKKFTVSYSNETYTPLDASRAIEIYGPTSAESFDIETPINTNILFDFCGTEMNTFHITESGGLSVNSSMAGEDYYYANIVAFLVEDMEPISENARLLMDTMTVAGHKVFIYEIRDFSIWEDSLLFNYQIWLHEGSNVLEIRMGNHNIPEGTFSYMEIDEFDSMSYLSSPLYSGIIYNNGDEISENYEDWNFHLASPLSKDSIVNMYDVEMASDDDSTFLLIMADYLWTTFPERGTVIRYTPIITEDSYASIPLFTKLKASIYPNPSESGVFTVQLGEDAKNTAIVLMDIKGRVLLNSQKNSPVFDIDLSSYANGTYFLQMNNGVQKVTMKLVKK